ncbi:translesion DNA synthesis-associated protein ImuA [Thalassotalea sp. Y01]|uniref:translesion DNA synthesis-associated protein ImuA n=1 Tax=Thalassotalea sp. Y01 TaxID=2729613 RepID=UPI00145D12B7|nr:translesion DNA synthesis-associated protein ImuA [Thalassotalea sp. Y01]NMP15423.1 translesion DNA synthesis-associated protein ImuA [Thalassotalea sp. Y01]
MNELIDLLKHKQLVWHGNDEHHDNQGFSASGYEPLDSKLGGGFPKSGVIELLTQPGIGELRLLMPLMANADAQQLLVFINPPGLINSPSLQYANVDESRLLCLYPEQAHQALWAAEQCLQSGCCSDVLLWFDEPLQVHQVKRLQLAAQTGDCRQFLLRQQKADDIALPVDLSLSLASHQQGLEVTINKRKRGWPSAAFVVHLGRFWPWLVTVPEADNVVMFPDVRVVS